MLLCDTQRNGYKLGFEILKLSNFSPRMGIRMSFDTKNWANYWFLKPNKMSVTLDFMCISPKKGYQVVFDYPELCQETRCYHVLPKGIGINWVLIHWHLPTFPQEWVLRQALIPQTG